VRKEGEEKRQLGGGKKYSEHSSIRFRKAGLAGATGGEKRAVSKERRKTQAILKGKPYSSLQKGGDQGNGPSVTEKAQGKRRGLGKENSKEKRTSPTKCKRGLTNARL